MFPWMLRVYSSYMFLKETAAAGFKTGKSLYLPQFDGWTFPQHRTILESWCGVEE